MRKQTKKASPHNLPVKKGSRTVGNPGAFYDATQEAVLAALRSGVPISTACDHAMVSRTTFFNWLRRAEDGETRFVEFAKAVKQALANVEVRLLEVIEKASRSQWTAAAWILERRHPGKYGRRNPDPVGPQESESQQRSFRASHDNPQLARLEGVAP